MADVSRDLPIGNGALLVNFDHNYQLRDIYYPRVGQENHTSGEPCRFGIWVEGRFAWLDDPAWSKDLVYLPDTLVTNVTVSHPDLLVTVTFNDAVDLGRDALFRRVRVQNDGAEREVRLFFHFDWHIFGTEVGDTVMYYPAVKGLIAYKGQRCFAACAMVGDRFGLDGYTCGVITAIQEQSPDIAIGVEHALEEREEHSLDALDMLGAGDQGMMFGYACRETDELMPLPIALAHRLARRLSDVRKAGIVPYLRPDGKSQVSVEYGDGKPARVDTVLISAQHREEVDVETLLRPDVEAEVIDPVLREFPELTTEGADAEIDKLAKKYLGKDEYPWRNPEEERINVRIRPEHVEATGLDE